MGRKKDGDATVVMEIDGTESATASEQNGTTAPARAPKRIETKRQRFLRLVETRMGNAIKRISHVANLGKKAQYEYTDEEATKIVNALMAEVDSVGRAFSEAPRKSGGWTL